MSFKKSSFFLSAFAFIFVTACQTSEQANVEKALFVKEEPSVAYTANPYNAQFAAKIAGIYKRADNSQLTINADGSFSLGTVSYSIHEALNDYQAVYVAATPDEEKAGRFRYTYHGFYNNGRQVFLVPFKAGVQQVVDPRASVHAWEANTFRADNIHWQSSLLTLFATREN